MDKSILDSYLNGRVPQSLASVPTIFAKNIPMKIPRMENLSANKNIAKHSELMSRGKIKISGKNTKIGDPSKTAA